MQAEEKTVDIDTSGPGAEVQLEEEKKPENETVEVQNETNTELESRLATSLYLFFRSILQKDNLHLESTFRNVMQINK